MAIRTRYAQASTILAATLGLAVVTVVSSASHEQDESPAVRESAPGRPGVLRSQCLEG